MEVVNNPCNPCNPCKKHTLHGLHGFILYSFLYLLFFRLRLERGKYPCNPCNPCKTKKRRASECNHIIKTAL